MLARHQQHADLTAFCQTQPPLQTLERRVLLVNTEIDPVNPNTFPPLVSSKNGVIVYVVTLALNNVNLPLNKYRDEYVYNLKFIIILKIPPLTFKKIKKENNYIHTYIHTYNVFGI